MEYLTPRDFYTLGSLVGSRSWEKFLFANPSTEYLFCSSRQNRKSNNRKGRTYLRNVFHFRQAVLQNRTSEETRKGRRKRRRDEDGDDDRQPPAVLNRIGIFSGLEEESILVDDADGYFGMAFFRSGVLAVWGDYSGIFLAQHVDRILSSTSFKERMPSMPTSHPPTKEERGQKEDKDDNNNNQKRYNDFSWKDGSGYLFADSHQVVAVHFGTPYSFLGFALGQIKSVDTNPVCETESATPVEDTEESNRKTEVGTEYPFISECLYHFPNGEISSLCPVDDQHLVSSCMGRNQQQQQQQQQPRQRNAQNASTILIHWNALKDGNLQRISEINLQADYFDDSSVLHDVSPMAMASSSFHVTSDGTTSSSVPHTILSIGSSGQALCHLCLWETSDEQIASEMIGGNEMANESSCNSNNNNNNNNKNGSLSSAFQLLSIRIKSKNGNGSSTVPEAYRQKRFHNRNRHIHHFVYLKYFERTKLVVGTSKGDLFKIDMEIGPESSRGEEHGANFNSVLFNCCRGGMVEAVELVGHSTTSHHHHHHHHHKSPILITAGGNDGRIRFWDWTTFAPLGSLRIHPGQPVGLQPGAVTADDSLLRRRHGRNARSSSNRNRNRNRSPVVSTFFCHERSSLISFCRDGHVHEWKVEDEAEKLVMITMDDNDKNANDGDADNGEGKQYVDGSKKNGDLGRRSYRTRRRDSGSS
eukprot:jgi/Psemu1/56510/gm1.56510_g